MPAAMKEAIVAAAFVLVAAGCAPQTHTSSSTTATTTSHAQAVRAWDKLTRTHIEDLGIAVGKASIASSSQDYAGLEADCHQGHDAAEAVEGQMPTPDKELTEAPQASLSDFHVASHFCIAAVEDKDANEARHAREFLSSADGHLTTATAIRDRILN
jgi:hypothetical protein